MPTVSLADTNWPRHWKEKEAAVVLSESIAAIHSTAPWYYAIVPVALVVVAVSSFRRGGGGRGPSDEGPSMAQVETSRPGDARHAGRGTPTGVPQGYTPVPSRRRCGQANSRSCVEYIDPVTTIRLATLDDLPQIARVHMRAFEDDPLITWMLPPDDFDRRATLLFDCMIRAAMIHESTYTTDDGVCTAVWAPPEAWALSKEQIEMMAEPFAEAAGERVDRALGVLTEMAEVHPSEPHWYLEGLGTHPDWQRRGIASAVLAPVLGHCDADGLPAYLETQRESNVPYYRRHGFEVIGTKQLSNGAPNMWLMWRDVRPVTQLSDGR